MADVRCSQPGCDAQTGFDLDDPGDGEPYSFTLEGGWTVWKNPRMIDTVEFRCPRHRQED